MTRAGGRVLDCKRVVVVLDDVKIDVGLGRSHHPWSTFDPDANVTCGTSDNVSLASSVAKRTLCGPERTLSSLAAVHCEVGGLVGLQAHLLHTWTINLHVLWMAALPNCHLGNRSHSQTGYFWRWKQKIRSVCIYPEGTVGDIDISPGDDDGVFDGLRGDVDTEEGSVSVVCNLDVDGETLGILKTATPPPPTSAVTMCQSEGGHVQIISGHI